MSFEAEADRQQRLLAALWAQTDAAALPVLHESGARATLGLRAYRGNAGALAERALSAVFITVQAMLGGQDFKHLAREFWRAHPPLCGDMGEWGAEFPGWLQAHAAFAEWPWLADCARLDLAIHHCERAADGALDAGSLNLLQSVDPSQLHMSLMPGTAALSSIWPIVTIHRAHQSADQHAGDGEPARGGFDEVRNALQAQRGEGLVVARGGWRARVHAVDEATLTWTRGLLEGAPLSQSLERAGAGFDFATWLALALREGWIVGVHRGPAAACANPRLSS